MQPFPFSQIAPALLPWYQKNARSLPFRDSPTPYRVWISEVMLQQTRVAAVIPYYERFMTALPTVEHLANVPEERLMKLWEGLGYYSRARNLHKAAQVMVERHGGQLPRTKEELLALPGIGPYTAGAICSIAYGQPVPAVDGNVLRVMTRLTADPMDISLPKNRALVEAWVQEAFPKKDPGDFTQALMELGATVCLPGAAPLCGECPLSFLCRARGESDPTRYPVKSPKKARRREKHTVFVLEAGGSVALVKRPPRGLLASLWQFPMAPGHLGRAEAQKTAERWGLSLIQFCALPPSKHIFTHIEWEMNGYLMRVEEPAGDFVWADLQELETVYAIPSAFAPFLTAAKNLLDSGHFPAL